MSLLFSPLTIRDTTFPNRLWVAAMCQYSAVDGVVNDWHHVHLAQFASGGAGAIISEATAVVPEGRISPEDAGLWNDDQVAAWAPITRSIRERGSVPGVQLAHAGRKASTYRPWADAQGSVPLTDGGWRAEAPSAVAYEGFAEPVAMTRERVAEVVSAFAAAARRAVAAGFEVLEIHAAHGYLIHEFLSPLSNERTDEYGGSLENRARLVLDIVRAIRAEVGGSVPVFVRFSATDSAPGGLVADDVAQVAAWAEEAGADLFDVSTSGLVAHQSIDVFPGYQVPHAAVVKKAVAAPVGAVGIITSGEQGEQILQAGGADVILAAREWLRDPHFGLRAATELGESASVWPEQYVRARRTPAS
ncbi:NADH:flavin oxidoreductase/NADH oxidase [Microbacterium indicum]|uniref:NADH:flavin oxidoreductase/NADH oxidase n=1 Tax=Microbacterium indicum TaxID=358100 RepID=UPI000425F5DA|nr:NADH:flavin oxidoreductase/NADH oxidase [Microbacterium indicum]